MQALCVYKQLLMKALNARRSIAIETHQCQHTAYLINIEGGDHMLPSSNKGDLDYLMDLVLCQFCFVYIYSLFADPFKGWFVMLKTLNHVPMDEL